MKKFKLHIYKQIDRLTGNIDHVEFFNTFLDMAARYKQLYKKENGLLNPTAWEYKTCIDCGINWGVMWCKIPDVTMYNTVTI